MTIIIIIRPCSYLILWLQLLCVGIILHVLHVNKRVFEWFLGEILWLYFFFFCQARHVSIEISFLYKSWTESIIQCLVNFFHLEFIKVFIKVVIFTVLFKAPVITLLTRLLSFSIYKWFFYFLIGLFLRNLYLVLWHWCLRDDFLDLKTKLRNIIFQHLIGMHQVLPHVILLIVDFHFG